MSDRDEIIRTATTATLRQVAGWVSDDSLRDAIYEAADAVERSGPDDWWCCPVCEEVECDDGCPLEPIRLDYERRKRVEVPSGLSRESNDGSSERPSGPHGEAK